MSNPISRRELLKWVSAGTGAAVVGGGTWALGRYDNSPNAQVGASGANTLANPTTTADTVPTADEVTEAPAPTPSAPGDRMLVVIELGGGNDGMSTVVPYGFGEYYDLRQRTAIGEADLLPINDQFAFHSKLANINRRGAAVFQGVGTPEPDGSHFEMMARWWNGSPTRGGAFDTGFLGRLADAIGDPSAAAAAVSIGSGSHPSLISRKAGTLSIPNAYSFRYLVGAGDDDPFRQAFQRGYLDFGQGQSANRYAETLRQLKSQSVDFANGFGEFDPDSASDYPGTELGRGLRLAAHMLATDNGVRIVHVPMNEDFDTHDGHAGRHPQLLESLDLAVEAFLADIEARGMADRVLVMTTSEFGRTARDNASGGLDHGTASMAMLLGPVNGGLFGEHPSLSSLDDNDNLIATMLFDQYYATVAEGWFGVPASDVLSSGATPLDGVFI
jgi:uncharacterized protein (DUF1501 family)